MAATVLISTDFSENSLNAALYGLQLLGDQIGAVKLLNTFEEPAAGASSMKSISAELLKESRNGLSAFQEKLTSAYPFSGKLSRISEEGGLPYVIDNLEEVEKVDLILMGTQGASGLEEVFMGTNTSDVIAKCEMPLLAVPANCTYAAPNKIMIADDGQGCEDGTLRLARLVARKYSSEIHIVAVVDDAADSVTEHSYDPESFDDIDTHFHVLESNDVDEALNDFVEANQMDMVVMIHRHLSLFDRLFSRSSTKLMSMHTTVPLLVLQDG